MFAVPVVQYHIIYTFRIVVRVHSPAGQFVGMSFPAFKLPAVLAGPSLYLFSVVSPFGVGYAPNGANTGDNGGRVVTFLRFIFPLPGTSESYPNTNVSMFLSVSRRLFRIRARAFYYHVSSTRIYLVERSPYSVVIYRPIPFNGLNDGVDRVQGYMLGSVFTVLRGRVFTVVRHVI